MEKENKEKWEMGKIDGKRIRKKEEMKGNYGENEKRKK